jgi:hypothetical protein
MRAASTDEVRRIVLLDAPSVLPSDVRRELSESYGLGLVRTALQEVKAAGHLAVGPVEAVAPVLLAALHEAATQIADGYDPKVMTRVVEGILKRLCTTTPL